MIDQVHELFTRFGVEYYGEEATQLSHALQCARLAQLDNCPPALVAAALLHDIGQFIDDAGNAAETLKLDARHEAAGAAFLRRWFPESVTEPIRLHVDAKRYLCAVEPDYAAGLSRASVLSLQFQGGPMSPAEARQFERQPYVDDAVRLRRYDDAGKQAGLEVPALETYFPLLEQLAQASLD